MGNRKKTTQEKLELAIKKYPKGTKKHQEARAALLDIYGRQRSVVMQSYRQSNS